MMSGVYEWCGAGLDIKYKFGVEYSFRGTKSIRAKFQERWAQADSLFIQCSISHSRLNFLQVFLTE